MNRRTQWTWVGFPALCALLWGNATGPDSPPYVPTDTVEAALVVRIGHDANPDATFGDVTSVAIDDFRRIYVADRIGSTISVYETSGSRMAVLGGEGEGPGEFRWPADIVFDKAGRLWTRDGHRITVLAPRTSGAIPDTVVETIRLPGYGNLASTRSRVDESGRYLYPAYHWKGSEVQRDFFLPVSGGVFTADTIEVPPYSSRGRTKPAYVQIGRSGGRMVHGLSAAPFAPVPSWAITSHGTLLSSDGGGPVTETDHRFDTLQFFEHAGVPRAVPPTELADSATVLRTRIDDLEVPLRDVVHVDPLILNDALPETLPAVLSVHVGTDDRVWIQRWHPAGLGDRRYFDVASPAGRPLCTVDVPVPLQSNPPPFFSANQLAGVVVDPLTDVEHVVVLSLPGDRCR